MPKKYYTTEQLAIILETSQQQIRSSRVSGKLYGMDSPKYIRMGERKILYPIAEVESYLEKIKLQQKTIRKTH